MNAKIREAAKRTSTNTFLTQRTSSLSLYQISNRTTHHSLLYNDLHKPTLPLLLIKPLLYSFSSCSSNAFQLFNEMPHRGRDLELTLFYHVIGLIKSFTARPTSVTSRIAHCLAFKVGALAHLPTSTSLLIAYSRAADFSSSWALFDEIVYRDVILWNAMITASVENQCFEVAVNLFLELMREEGVGFDSTTLLIVVSASSHMGNLTQGRVLHGISFKTGGLSDSFLCNALIDMYAKCGELSLSECVFDGMECRDLISWNSIMRGCAYNNYPEKCFCYFKKMAYSSEVADNVSLTCAVSASALLGKLSFGQAIHGWGIKLGYKDTSHNSFENSLITLYSQCGDIEAAEILFKEMKYKDVISWNAMLEGLALNQRIWEAFDLLHEMQFLGCIQPDSVTVLTIIPLCAELMFLREGRAVHGLTVRREIGSHLSVTNSLIDMYSKCKDVKMAEQLFKAIPGRDLVSWNAMISGYSQNGHSREAQYLFKQLLQSYSQFSLSTLLAILPSCDSSEFLQFGKSIHCWQTKLGFANNTLAVNSLMLMYVNCGDLLACFSLLQTVSAAAAADIDSWNTAIAGCTQNGHFWEALKAFNIMREDPIVVCHDSVTLFNLISACGNLELVFEGGTLHGLALKTSLESDIRVQNALITMYGRCGEIENARTIFRLSCSRNLYSWNCMISAFSQNKDGRKALELFRHIEFEPNEITIVGILSACTQLGLLRHGKQIHSHVIRFGFQGNSFVSAALLDMYSNCGRLDTAIQIFRSSPEPERSVAAWNSMISAFGFHSNGRKAIELFHEMWESGTRPTKSTFISLLSACSHTGLVNEGVRYYNNMWELFDVEAETEHHVCMVDMLGRAGRLDEAYEFIRQIPTRPEPGVWGALLSACKYHGDLKMGREVAELLFELEPDNVGYYISLSNMYVAAGRWKDAVELRRMVEDKGLKKPAAYSLIDVGMG